MSRPVLHQPQNGTKRCSKCGKEKVLRDFVPRPHTKAGYYPHCRHCASAQALVRYRRTRTIVSEKNRMKKYGLGAQDIAAMLSAQRWECPICRAELTGQSACVDHDHNTGRIRGLLCRRCNIAIGLLDDRVGACEAAIRYLGGADIPHTGAPAPTD